jgi:hypothetical protein
MGCVKRFEELRWAEKLLVSSMDVPFSSSM